MSTRLFLSRIHYQRRNGFIRDALAYREKLLSAAGTEAARRKASRPRLRIPVMRQLLLLVPVRCFFCLLLLPPRQRSIELLCGRRCAARRGDGASSCVARTQHWMPNRKISISMGPFLYMDVLYALRLNLCL
ncbi:hypothetical protein TcCL_NonESM11023 [Trypanosoma cruzi]|nr:hypothetical protein TcCL_NonESM11023 [Trypanosoma cruzi]